ncbi:hypothetical protein RJ639_003065 [Escallonia herrerae]|uniref:Uncharacterized protein n=1 Tax=Escallonia herrerae TaxID=1293975 RepID=A0AA88W5E2_9ASTE|nr:hypothetical protein RJ639_003065 [Escallonia herrerae]
MLKNLADVRHFPTVDATIVKAKSITKFIYNYGSVTVMRSLLWGYLYEAIDKANETIKSNLKNRLYLYMPVLRVIDARWVKQLSSPLHSAVPDDYMQDLISLQLEEHKQATGDFGMAIAIRQHAKLNPDLDNDGGWDVLQLEPAIVNLEDEEVHYEDEEDALHDVSRQYDWDFGGETDPYHHIDHLDYYL